MENPFSLKGERFCTICDRCITAMWGQSQRALCHRCEADPVAARRMVRRSRLLVCAFWAVFILTITYFCGN